MTLQGSLKGIQETNSTPGFETVQLDHLQRDSGHCKTFNQRINDKAAGPSLSVAEHMRSFESSPATRNNLRNTFLTDIRQALRGRWRYWSNHSSQSTPWHRRPGGCRSGCGGSTRGSQHHSRQTVEGGRGRRGGASEATAVGSA